MYAGDKGMNPEGMEFISWVDGHALLDNIPQDVINQTLNGLPGYVRQHHLPHGIVHELSTASREYQNN
jgi:hypothetical protein